MRFLLVHPIFLFPMPIELSRLITSVTNDLMSIQIRSDWSIRDHRFKSKFGTHCLTNGLVYHAPLNADEEYVLRIIHREIAVATRLLVSLVETPQVRVETAITWERLPGLPQVRKVRGMVVVWKRSRFSQEIAVARSCVTAFHCATVSFSNSSSFLLG